MTKGAGLTDNSVCLSEGATVTKGAGLTDSSVCLSEGATVSKGAGLTDSSITNLSQNCESYLFYLIFCCGNMKNIFQLGHKNHIIFPLNK